MVTSNDKNLVFDCINNKPLSYEKLYDYCKPYVSSIVKKSSFNVVLEETCQDILSKIFLNLNSFNPDKSALPTWVTTIAKNHISDLEKSKSRSKLIYNADLIPFESKYFNTSDSISTSNSDDLMRIIKSYVSETEYKMLELKYLYDYKYDDIADECCVTATEVSNKINYLKKKLNRKLAPLF